MKPIKPLLAILLLSSCATIHPKPGNTVRTRFWIHNTSFKLDSLHDGRWYGWDMRTGEYLEGIVVRRMRVVK